MATKTLTPDLVEEARTKRGKQQSFVWDRASAGLGLRVTTTGRKSWAYRYTLHGKERRITVAKYPSTSLEDARKMAAEALTLVQSGIDPKGRSLTPQGEGLTIEALWERFRDTHLHRPGPDGELIPRRSSGHIRNCTDQFERLILPYFGKERAVESLTWDDVHAWHQSLADTPTQANRALAALRVALRKARRWDGWNLTGPNPATDHELHPERKAQTGRPLTAMEWKRLGPALLHEEDPVQLAALSVYLLTGLRPGEVCSLRWEDLEDGGVIRLDGKTGPRRAVLSERAERLIRTMPRVGGFVFPGRLAGDPLGGENDSHGLGGIWKRMQGAGVTARCYDCRHSWVTAAAEKGVGDDVRRVLSGHAGASGTAHSVYLHATEGMRKAADLVAEELVKRFDADAVEARIAELIQTEKDAKSQHG